MSDERPRWMRYSPGIATLGLIIMLTRHFGFITTAEAFGLGVAIVAYLSGVIMAEQYRARSRGECDAD